MAKRTILEVYILLNKKRENAIRDKDRIVLNYNNSSQAHDNLVHLNGEIDAYTDVIILLETSGLIKPKNEEEFKELFVK